MRIINKPNFKTIESGDEGYNDLKGFTEVKADAGAKGEIGITTQTVAKECVLLKIFSQHSKSRRWSKC